MNIASLVYVGTINTVTFEIQSQLYDNWLKFIFYVKTSICRFAIVYVSEPAEIIEFLVTQPILFTWRNERFHEIYLKIRRLQKSIRIYF